MNKAITSIFLQLCFVILTTSHPADDRTTKGTETINKRKPFVYLTVSSLIRKHEPDRLLELNWHRVDLSQDGLKVNLYDRDPRQNGQDVLSALVSVVPDNKGYYRTSVRFPHHFFKSSNLTNECLGFWIALTQRDGAILASSCIRSQPTWMQDNRADIGHLSLLDLMIPGTHNTGSYSAEEGSFIQKYLYTQDEDVFHQLAYGIRFLDLRVAYHDYLSEKFWVTHSAFRLDVSVRDVLRQVRKFLDATQEVVILDFHRFVNGFQKSDNPRRRHKELQDLIEREVGLYMIPGHFTSGATLNQLWESGKRLYVGYAVDSSRPDIFPAVRHLWGDVDKPGKLHAYLNSKVCEPRGRLTSAMAQLTPTTVGLIFNSYGGLRKMADKVSRKVDRWFREEWRRCGNVVATDYFLGNRMVETAIEINRERGKAVAANQASVIKATF